MSDSGDGHQHDHDEHEAVHAHEHDFGPVGVAVVTVSTSRTLEDDPAGDAIAAAVEADDELPTRELIPDEYDEIQGTVDALAGRDDVDCIVTTGGTGVTPDDVTIEAVRPLFGKELPGFGELFRARSREDIGTRVVATRATGGVADGVPIFCLPGSEDAARLGADIITEEAGHLVGLAGRESNDVDETEK
jgi:molybdenum cofactor biosynthesis protein B